MNFPQDGGLSCVRFFLRRPMGDSLERITSEALEARSKIIGRLNCHHCGEVDSWTGAYSESRQCFMASCGCNGSTLPVYIGAPPASGTRDWSRFRCLDCGTEVFSLVVGIGYSFEALPQLGSLDVERAIAIAAGLCCRNCKHQFVGWRLNRPQPPEITGNEPWLRRIQGLQRV